MVARQQPPLCLAGGWTSTSYIAATLGESPLGIRAGRDNACIGAPSGIGAASFEASSSFGAGLGNPSIGAGSGHAGVGAGTSGAPCVAAGRDSACIGAPSGIGAASFEASSSFGAGLGNPSIGAGSGHAGAGAGTSGAPCVAAGGNDVTCECAKCRRLVARRYEAWRKREYRRKLKEGHNLNPSHLILARCQAISKLIVNCFKQHTKDLDKETRESILKDVLNDGCMRGLNIEKQDHPVLLGLRDTLTTIKKPKNNKELFLKRATIMMAMRAPRPNIYAASKILGMHRRNFYAARLKLRKDSLPLDLCEREARTKDAITDEVKELVISF